jgi:hypothetical protein
MEKWGGKEGIRKMEVGVGGLLKRSFASRCTHLGSRGMLAGPLKKDILLAL